MTTDGTTLRSYYDIKIPPLGRFGRGALLGSLVILMSTSSGESEQEGWGLGLGLAGGCATCGLGRAASKGVSCGAKGVSSAAKGVSSAAKGASSVSLGTKGIGSASIGAKGLVGGASAVVGEGAAARKVGTNLLMAMDESLLARMPGIESKYPDLRAALRTPAGRARALETHPELAADIGREVMYNEYYAKDFVLRESVDASTREVAQDARKGVGKEIENLGHRLNRLEGLSSDAFKLEADAFSSTLPDGMSMEVKADGMYAVFSYNKGGVSYRAEVDFVSGAGYGGATYVSHQILNEAATVAGRAVSHLAAESGFDGGSVEGTAATSLSSVAMTPED